MWVKFGSAVTTSPHRARGVVALDKHPLPYTIDVGKNLL